jgi:multiple sugar transport system substrate-binding protein
MKRHVAALVVVAGLLAAACSGTGDGGAVDTEGDVSGKISFLLFGDPEEIAAYRQLVDAFEQAEPNVTVSLIEASDRDDLIARLSTSFAGGTPPDLFLINYRFFGQFAVKNVLEPLEAPLNASKEFEPEDFYPQAMEAFQVEGQQVCLPQNISSLVVYYNKDLFAEAELSAPPEGWTWDDMLEVAADLTKDLDGDNQFDQHGLGVEPSIIRVAPFVWSNGGEVVDDDANPTRFALDSPEALEALQQFFDLTSHNVMPREEEIESEDLETRFMNGRLGMFMSSRRDTPLLRTITDFDWDVAALPQHKEPASILHSDAYCMTTASKNKSAAWRFVEFALGPQGAPITARSGRTVPSLIEVAESDAFLNPGQKPASSQIFLDTIPVIRRVPNISTWPEIEDAVDALLEQGLFEGADAEEVVADIMAATEDIFARAE